MIQTDALTHDGISHGFFTREGGFSTGIFSSLNCGLGSGDERDTVLMNRALVAQSLGVSPSHLLSAWQIHSAEAAVVDGPWTSEERPRADALVTKTPGVGLGVLTADCGPVLFADRQAGVIGAAHAGWKGALTGVTTRTLEVMEGEGATRANITAVIGPMISRAAYEVGPEFPARFIDADPENARYFTPSARAGHAMFDLPAYLEDRLTSEGVGRVVNLSLCTFGDEMRFFSYRRTTHRNEKDYGRLISAISLNKD
ncbi:peptidoglycan editing factor PgeF [Aestuariivirga sp.]|uniref:peptidoglycan editing factor PgeF n=1 Tax=Aestuariivirga sp. TaxID=2650926 RepID=UPI00359445E8